MAGLCVVTVIAADLTVEPGATSWTASYTACKVAPLSTASSTIRILSNLLIPSGKTTRSIFFLELYENVDLASNILSLSRMGRGRNLMKHLRMFFFFVDLGRIDEHSRYTTLSLTQSLSTLPISAPPVRMPKMRSGVYAFLEKSSTKLWQNFPKSLYVTVTTFILIPVDDFSRKSEHPFSQI